MPRKKKANQEQAPVVHTNPETLPEYEPPTTEVVEAAPSRDEITSTLSKLRQGTMDSEVAFVAQLLALPDEGNLRFPKAYGCLEVGRTIQRQRKMLFALLGEVVNAVHNAKLYLWVEEEGIAPTEQSFWTDGCGFKWAEIQELLIYKTEIVPVLETVGIDSDDFWKRTSSLGISEARKTVKQVRKQVNQPYESKPSLDEKTKQAVADSLTDLLDKRDADIKQLRREQSGQPTRFSIPGMLSFIQQGDEVRWRVTFEGGRDDLIAFQENRAYWGAPRLNGQPIDMFNIQEMLERQQSIVDEGGRIQTLQIVPTVAAEEDDPLEALADLSDEDYTPKPIERAPLERRSA